MAVGRPSHTTAIPRMRAKWRRSSASDPSRISPTDSGRSWYVIATDSGARASVASAGWSTPAGGHATTARGRSAAGAADSRVHVLQNLAHLARQRLDLLQTPHRLRVELLGVEQQQLGLREDRGH